MKLLVIGATGGTGQAVVTQALDKGHTVTAMARNPSAATINHDRCTVVRGDVLDPDSLRAAVAGQDAVLSTLGPRTMAMRPITTFSEGTGNVIQAMDQQGVRRGVFVSSAGVDRNDPGGNALYRWVLRPIFMRQTSADFNRLEAKITGSDLDWTIVRPYLLTDGPHTGNYRVAVNGIVSGGRQISRADLASFILDQLSDARHSKATTAIAY